jgi:alkylation response protein AidB-like acyl-CoA dehydrogenase
MPLTHRSNAARLLSGQVAATALEEPSSMNDALPRAALDAAEESQLLDTIERWVARELKPIVREYDHADRYPAHIVEQMKALGLFGATVATEYGGLGLPATTYAKIVMSISSVWMSITGIINSHLMLALAIEKFGTPEQKSRWLPKIATGEIRGGLALTEPDAGTDLQGIRMTARRDGGDYIINGTKTWITNGIEGSCFAMLVKTDPAAQPRHKGMSLFIAPKMQGFTVGRKLEKLGYKSIDSAELVFDNYRVPADHLIGGVEGQGFYQATGGLELGRINVAARGVGIAEGALKLAADYAQVRKTFGKPICEHQAIQLKLGEMATRARAARLLTLDAAASFDRGERCDMEAGMAKYFSSEAALENSIEGMRIHGAYGYSKEFDIERLYRDAPLTCIGEGTNEMQRIIISKQWVKRNPAA